MYRDHTSSVISISVPSSSGNSLQRKIVSYARLQGVFQSPLHRGTPFNGARPGAASDKGQISVPSSSGNSLQRVHCAVLLQERNHFSPLFIGELPSTEPFEIETHSLPHFSPLFIGELPSTPVPRHNCERQRIFQSPLHRGTPFNRGREPGRRSAIQISVPSSSGNSLQRRITGWSAT